MIEFSQSEVRGYYTARLPHLKQSGPQLVGPCPVHQGKDPNFKVEISSGRSFCHSRCGRGWDIISLEQELSGRGFVEAKVSVFAVVGRPEIPWAEREFVSTFDYTDPAGRTLYQVVRLTPDPSGKKRFMQRRPDANGGWISGLGDVEHVPFMLPKIIASSGTVAITEGEKDAMTLSRMGIVATCNNGGARNFRPELAKWFAGRKVAVFFDNDEPGREHALKVAGIMKPVAASVKIVELPELPAGGDVTDFVRNGGTKAQIKERLEIAQEWTPEWEFGRCVPSEEDRYVKTPSQIIESFGGMESFWAMPEDEGIPTPFPELTRAMAGGLRDQEVYVIGGDTGSGKTSLGLQFALHSMRRKKGVLLFSMEMSHKDVIQRMASMEARVDLLRFREAQRKNRDRDYSEMAAALGRASNELTELPLLVSDKGGVNCRYILSETERLRYRAKIDLVIVDHMQLMDADEKTRGDYEKFTSISRAMKKTAKEMRIPVIQVSQTSRSGSKDGRTELEISDLRGSGAIEEDACTVMLLFPDKEDRARAVAAGTLMQGPVKSWLKLGKNRFGWKDWSLEMLHFKSWTRFDVEQPHYAGENA